MNEKKNTFLRVNVDTNTDLAFKKIIEIKGLTIQSVLEDLVKEIEYFLSCVDDGYYSTPNKVINKKYS